MSLTPTEHAAQALQMDENRLAKCDRCAARIDIASGGELCFNGEDPPTVRALPGGCRSFSFDASGVNWK